MAGYSGTPLTRKLGIAEGMTVACLDAPSDFVASLQDVPEGVRFHAGRERSDLYILFARWARDLERRFHEAMAALPADGAIWVAWPKRSSGVETDLGEDTLRDLFLPTGMVDNKVCAIDETWSGLRFVVRRENRATWGEAGR